MYSHFAKSFHKSNGHLNNETGILNNREDVKHFWSEPDMHVIQSGHVCIRRPGRGRSGLWDLGAIQSLSARGREKTFDCTYS